MAFPKPIATTIYQQTANEGRFRKFQICCKTSLQGHITHAAKLKASQFVPLLIQTCSQRHACGWGQLDPEDRDANEKSPKHGGRLFSRYDSTANVKFWIITESPAQIQSLTGFDWIVNVTLNAK